MRYNWLVTSTPLVPMGSQDATLDIAKAQRIFQATRSLLFADIPAIDLKDRVSVFTVAAGIRSIGVLETWGQWLPRLRDAMIANGLFTSVGTAVWSAIERPPDHPYRNVLLALDAKRVAGKPKHVLWVYATRQERDEYRQLKFTQQQAGAILGYPPCCIEFESSIMARLPEAQLQKLIAESLKKMPKVEGLVLDLYYRQELGIREIAPILNLHITRVSQIKAQAILRLRNYLGRHWPTTKGTY